MNRLDRLEHIARIITGADLPPCYGIQMENGTMFILEGEKKWTKETTPEQAHEANQDKINLCRAFNGVEDVMIIGYDDYMASLTGSDSIAGT